MVVSLHVESFLQNFREFLVDNKYIRMEVEHQAMPRLLIRDHSAVRATSFQTQHHMYPFFAVAGCCTAGSCPAAGQGRGASWHSESCADAGGGTYSGRGMT